MPPFVNLVCHAVKCLWFIMFTGCLCEDDSCWCGTYCCSVAATREVFDWLHICYDALLASGNL
jgi:hypothetical protein